MIAKKNMMAKRSQRNQKGHQISMKIANYNIIDLSMFYHLKIMVIMTSYAK
jgi:hypothetical protein